MAATSCLFEPFRNPSSEVEIRSCLLKLYAVHGDVSRKAKRSNKTIPEAELPVLWILTPTFSARMIQGFGATETNEESFAKGVYSIPRTKPTALAVRM
jgi:hypothetical protein